MKRLPASAATMSVGATAAAARAAAPIAMRLSQSLALRCLISGRNVLLLGVEGSGKSTVLQEYVRSLGPYQLSNHLASDLHGQVIFPKNSAKPVFLSSYLLGPKCVNYINFVLRRRFQFDEPFGGVQVGLGMVLESEKVEVPEFDKDRFGELELFAL